MLYFLVCVFPFLGWIRRFIDGKSPYSVQYGEYRPEKTPYLEMFHAVTHTMEKVDTFFTALYNASKIHGPLDKGRKLKIQKTIKRRHERLLSALCTFTLDYLFSTYIRVRIGW